MATSTSEAQSVVPLGSGSYSSTTPAANETEDSYYALPQNQVEEFYNYLKVDPSKANLPMPTNHWWTDLLIGSRSYLPSTPPGNTQYVLGQDLYGGNIWFIPGKVDPESYGLNISYPNTWKAPNANGSPQGSIDPGTNFVIKGNTPYFIPSGDTLIADFEGGFPAGTTQTGIANGGFIIHDGTGITGVGVMGASLANTRGNNATQGIVRLPDFTINKTYLNFLIAGGNFADTQLRVILSNGTTVATAQGLSSTNLRWVALDLTAWQGQTAHVELVDQNTGAYGFLTVDQIVLSNSNNMVGRFGGDYIADETVVKNWSDWSVDFDMPNAASGRNIEVTLTRGVPFTWTRWTNLKPRLTVGASPVFYNTSGTAITVTGNTFTASSFAVVVGGKNYGIFLPDNTVCNVGGAGAATYVEPQISGANNYLVVGYLPAISNLSEFGTYAYARPTNTAITWTNDPQNGRVITNWNITTTAMKGSNLQTLQGWIPHHYRTTTTNFPFKTYTYQTQRGIMKMASGNSFQINFPFAGIAPVLPAPTPKGLSNDFQPARMQNYLNNFNAGAMISDTYNSGKALLTCAQYMMIADQLGDTTNFNRFKTSLTTALTNWFTYTPGEANGFFASYPDWKATVGFNASYGSQAFNDLHFHYGYFSAATAFLGKYDQTFLTNYGPMIRLVTKSFANFDRNDTTNPFLRTFDVWEGHGNAGGFSGGNGVNQESSSEAMNSWVGVYMLGSVLNDNTMQSVGAMGFAMEGAATNEYWQDLYKTNFPASFDVAGAAMVWSDNFTYATYFDADPAWVYGIQYVPSSHWNNYLVRDQKTTVAQKYAAIWTERVDYMNSREAWSASKLYDETTYVNYNGHVWYNSVVPLAAGSPAPGTAGASWVDTGTFVGSTPEILGAYLGGYYLGYQLLWDTENTVVQFDNYFTAGNAIATNNGGAGNLYYQMHALRQLGEQDTTYSTSVPGAVYYNATTNTRTAVVYNPGASTATVNIYKNGASVQTLSVPARSQAQTFVGNTPVITSAWNPAAMVTAAFSYSITATNSPTSYSIVGTLPAGLSLNGTTGVISGTPTTAGTSTVTMRATNANGTGSATLVITVYPFTNPPVVSSASTAPGTVGAAFSYQITASNSPISYGVTGTLPTGLNVNTSTGLISGTPAAGTAGVYNVTVRATNAGGTGTKAVAISILENLALNVTGVSASSVTVGQEANKANDGNATSTRWTASGGAFPQWWQVDLGASKNIQRVDIAWFSAASRAYKYKIEAGTDGTNFPTLLKDNTANTTFGNTSDPFTTVSVRYVKVTVTGSTAGFASAYEIAVLGMPAQPAPVINSSLTANGSVGTAFSYQITATNSPINYNATGLPAGLSINTSTGLISGTPTVSFSGNVAISATNAGGTDTEQLALTVIQPVPVVTSPGTWNISQGSSASYQITATNSPTSFSITGTLPAGITLNTTTGLISGTPTAAGTSNVSLIASNAGGPSTPKPLVITVTAPAPVITSALTATGSVGTAFSYQITATNTPTSYNATGLPSGLTVNTGTGLISGTPTGTFSGNVALSATNASGTGTATLALSVISDTNQALNKTVTVSSFQVGNEPAKGNDGSGTTRWAAANGTFPAWWSVDLGGNKVLSKVDIDWLNPTSRSYKYKIEGGTDGVNFPTLIKDNTANTVIGNTSDPTTVTVRYVKITTTGSSSGGFASFFEAKVFGH